MAELTDREERVAHHALRRSLRARTSSATLRGRRVAFLARHGAGHRLLPSELNFRANIYGFKVLGVEWILSASAVGSLREDYKPLDLVVPDQFFDRTRGRVSTFFGDGRGRRTSASRTRSAEPLSDIMHRLRASAPAPRCIAAAPTCAWRARSSRRWPSRNVYRAWGFDIIGMTNLQEAKLAREAEICYATLALVTDYDCWHPDHDSVTVEMIIANLTQNAKTAQQVIAHAVERLPIARDVRVRAGARHGDHHAARAHPRRRRASGCSPSSASTSSDS